MLGSKSIKLNSLTSKSKIEKVVELEGVKFEVQIILYKAIGGKEMGDVAKI